MKKLFTKPMVGPLLLLAIIAFSTNTLNACSIAGTATASKDSICVSGDVTLQLSGYLGAIQWQSFDGTNWVNETGTGATSDSYTVFVSVTTDFRAFVTEPGCPSDSSNILTITVGLTAPVTTGDTRCGYGPVTLTASGGASNYRWYDVPTGGTALFTGPAYTTNVSATTTFYAAAVTGGGPPTPLTTTFASNNGFDGNMFDIIAINSVTIDSFAANLNAGTGTAEIWYRPGTHVGFTGSNAGWTLAGTAPYTSTATGAPGTSINVFVNVTIPAGQTYAFYVHGSAGIQYTNGTAVGNIYTQDANIQVTEGYGGAYFNLTNSPRVFNGRIMYSAGCESGRTPAVATVNAAPAITLNANPPALCQGQSSVLTVSSSNPNYTYTWSPATGLSGTTGTTVTATPLTPVTYTVVAIDGACGEIDSVFMSVGPASVAGIATISSDTICAGTDAYLQLTGYTGNIQWQSFDGTNWVNETGTGSTSDNYAVSPTSATIYQAVVTSGGCDPDTTITLNLDVLTIVDPITVNDTICDPGTVNLSASGSGLLNWYTAPTGGNSINTGTTYSPNIAATTIYYVQASAGGTYLVGPINGGFGNQNNVAGNDFGLQFDVTQQATLEKVYVSPAADGTVIINLRDTQGGPILNTVSAPVNAFSGLVPISLGFTVNPGTYRLEMGVGSAACYYNTTNAAYPYITTGSPVTITGYVNPAFNTGGAYYFFYNWEVNQGCSSNRIPVTGFVNAPAVPVISQNGTQLTSSALANNQWNLNGSPIPGATGTTYDMSLTGVGTYTVTVTENGCSSTSTPVIFTGINDDMTAAGISVYPNPVNDFIAVEFSAAAGEKTVVLVYNSIGELVLTQQIKNQKTEIGFDLPAGIYSVEIKTNDGVYVTKVVKQ